MKLYINHKNTAKEKKSFPPLAAKIIKSFCRGSRGAVFSKSAPLATGGKYE
jgi:hypothetical protein